MMPNPVLRMSLMEAMDMPDHVALNTRFDPMPKSWDEIVGWTADHALDLMTHFPGDESWDETMKRLTEEGGVVPEWGEDLDGLLEREDARMRKLTHPTRSGARGKDSDPNSNREGNWDRTTMMSGGHAPRSTNPSRPTLRP